MHEDKRKDYLVDEDGNMYTLNDIKIPSWMAHTKNTMVSSMLYDISDELESVLSCCLFVVIYYTD